tara:strand:+ start:45 stop:413 length:369 start_codon:yes stop_codon:yes gene_type:complete
MEKEKELEKSLKIEKNNLEKIITNRNDDYTYAREILYTSTERLQDILDAAVNLAKESEHPRAIEVATEAAKALGDNAAKMMDHHIKTEKLQNPSGDQKNVTNNNLNVKMNTKDLLELLNRDN